MNKGLQSTSWHDPVHGRVSIPDDAYFSDFSYLLRTQAVERLRRIKQVGYASYTYPMADHSRYSHAIGSMHVAGRLAERVIRALPNEEIDLLARRYPKLDKGGRPRASLSAHLRAAALLQDIGELPSESATAGIFRPNDELREKFEAFAHRSVGEFTAKSAYTVNLILRIDQEHRLQLLDTNLLACLAGVPSLLASQDQPQVFRRLLHILDSALDADRIDYVHRDAMCTIGSLGNPTRVIEAIEGYTEDSVIIEDPAVIGSFFVARNHLYRSVYLDPAKRLREMSLRMVLNELNSHRIPPTSWGPCAPPGALSLDDFLSIDDATLNVSLVGLSRDALSVGRLSLGGRRALATLVEARPSNYSCAWIAPSDVALDGAEKLDELTLPAGLVVDGRGDYARAALTNSSFIKVSERMYLGDERGSNLSAWIPEVANSGRSADHGALLCFVPEDLDAVERDQLESALATGTLYLAARRAMLQQQISVPSDTRSEPGFRGPSIHISWCWQDLDIVRRCMSILNRLRQRYFILIDPFEGVGAPPGQNSEELVATAESLLIFGSHAYLSRLRDEPNGNIARELASYHRRLSRDAAPPYAILAVDSWRVLHDGFPWMLLGGVEASYMGSKALVDCSDEELEEAMRAIISALGG